MIFRGSGFYITDYKKKETGASEAKAPEKAGGSKTPEGGSKTPDGGKETN